MSNTSHGKRSKPPSPIASNKEPIEKATLESGNSLMLATLAHLSTGNFPYEIHNLKVGGKWVAHIRLIGQQWTQAGRLEESKPCEP